MLKINHKESYQDFGKQFYIYQDIDGYFGSARMFRDNIYPYNPIRIKNKVIMDVGSGAGKILKNILRFSPKKIYSIEPSNAINIAKKNIKSNKIKFLNIKAENISLKNKIDIAFSIGVIHHIPNAKLAIRKIYESLKAKGQIIFWVYGYENNEKYIFFSNLLRRICLLLPDRILVILSTALNLLSYSYFILCKIFNLPLKDYLNNVFFKCSFKKRTLIIFDQLNPAYVKYYKKKDIKILLKNLNFKSVIIHNRQNYSWTVIATK